MATFDDFVAGYNRFRENGWVEKRTQWEAAAKGQSPKVMVIACSDSRVDPATIFDTSPGEVFIVRNVANLVPPFETGGGLHGVSAALEFAVTQLKVEEIVVIGHGSCGGVGASVSQQFSEAPPGEGGFVSDWISLLDEARDRVVAEHGTGQEAKDALELEGVRTSLRNLMTFPFVQKAVEAGELKLHGAWFGIAGGKLLVLDPKTDEFAAA